MDIQEFRKQYPQYNNIDDETLSKKLHQKYYADKPYEEFKSKFIPNKPDSSLGPMGPFDVMTSDFKGSGYPQQIVGALAKGEMQVGQAVLGAPSAFVRQAGLLNQYINAEAVLAAKTSNDKKFLLNQMSEHKKTFDYVADYLEQPAELHKLGQRVIEEKHPEWQTEAPESFKDLVTHPGKLGIAIAESMPLLINAGILTVAGQPNVAAGLMYVTEGEQAKEEALASGQNEDTAAIAYGVYGTVAAALEQMQLEGFLKVGKTVYNQVLAKTASKVARKGTTGLLYGTIKEAAKESLEETSQGTWGEITSKIVYGKGIEGGINGFIDRRLQEAYTAFMMTALTSVSGNIAARVQGSGVSNKQEIDGTNKQIVDSIPDEIEKKAEETGLSRENIVGNIQWQRIGRKVISRFPQKITDQASLEQVGNAIAQHMGVNPANIKWVFKSGPVKGYMGLHEGKVVDGVHTIRIVGMTGESFGKGGFKVTSRWAGQVSREKGQQTRHTQAMVKRAIVHELGHIVMPAYTTARGTRMGHHAAFADWVNEKVDQLFETKEGKVVPVAETKIKPVADTEATVQEPQGTIKVYHGSKEENLSLGKGKQKSGYYPGFYTTTNKESTKTFGPNIYEYEIDPTKFYTLKAEDSDNLKREAGEAGFGYNSGSGNAEVNYLKSQGYEGIKRGSEYIIFEPEKSTQSTPETKAAVREPQGKTVYRAGEIKGGLLHFGTEAAAKKAAIGRKISAYNININNPAKMIDSGRAHDMNPTAMIEDIIAASNPDLDPQLIPVINKIQKEQGDKAAFDAIKTALENHGYDGIEYTNVNEDKGSTSYVVFNPDQVTPAGAVESTPETTPKRTRSKRVLLALGHKIAREYAIPREDYQDYAEIVTGKRSMKDMSRAEAEQFVAALEEAFGSPKELTKDDFKKPIVVNGKATTMDNIFVKAMETLDALESKRKKQDVIKRGSQRRGIGTTLKHFFFGIDNTPVYHLAQILDNGEEGVVSDVLDKNIQRGQKTANAHNREVHSTLLKLLSDAGITPEDLARISTYANPRASIIQAVAKKTQTNKQIVEINSKKFEMTAGELLDIYLASRQEDGLRHLTKGGLVVNGVKTGLLSEDFILNLWDTVESDPKLKAITDAIYYIGENIWQPSINQVSNRLDGKDIATVKNWWGLEVYNPQRLVGKSEKISKRLPELNLIEDKGILKDRTKSDAPLIIRDALSKFSVFEGAISDYVGMAEPTRISRTLLNDPRINTLIDQKGYKDVLDTIKAIHKRAQSISQPEGSFSELINRNISGLYRAVLFFNPRVIASQATSAFNYGAYVSPEYITGLKDMMSIDAAKDTLELSDVAWSRFFMGHSSLELGEMAKTDATLRFWTDKASDANKLGWAMKVSDLSALAGGMQIAQMEYENAQSGKMKGLSAEWWIDKGDLPEANLEMWKRVQEQGEQADPTERQAVEQWKNIISERAEYLWQRTQPSWDKWNRSNLTSQKGLRSVFLLFRSFHEKSLTIFNQAKLEYDHSPKTIEDKTKFVQRTSAVATSYTVNVIIRAAIMAVITRSVEKPYEYFKDLITSWTGLIPVLGRVLDTSIRNFMNAAVNAKHEYRGEPLESLPIETFNVVLKVPDTMTTAMGDLIEGDTESAENNFKKGIGDLVKGIGLLYGIPVYEIKRLLPDEESEPQTSRTTTTRRRAARR